VEWDDLKWPPIRNYLQFFSYFRYDSPVFYVFWVFALCVTLFLFKRLIVRRGSPRIQYFITDIWTTVLVLMPSFALLSFAKDDEQTVLWPVIGLFIVSAVNTLGGIWVWLMLAMPAADEPPPGRESHFISVLGGGFVGFLSVFVTGLTFAALPGFYAIIIFLPKALFALLVVWFYSCVAMPPLFVATLFAIWFIKKAYDAYV